MKQSTKAKVLKLTRKLHAWMGIIVFPLIFIAGFTGFYLNHANTLFSFLKSEPYDETQFQNWPDKTIASIASSTEMANRLWPDTKIERITYDQYHDRPSYHVTTSQGLLIVSKETSHYFVKSSFRRYTYAPDGTLLHSKFYWGTLFKWLHVRGWPGELFGTLLTDISSIALILFALSGAILWWLPRFRKMQRKLQGLFSS